MIRSIRAKTLHDSPVIKTVGPAHGSNPIWVETSDTRKWKVGPKQMWEVGLKKIGGRNLGAYIISVTMKSTICIHEKMVATNGGATVRSLGNRG